MKKRTFLTTLGAVFTAGFTKLTGSQTERSVDYAESVDVFDLMTRVFEDFCREESATPQEFLVDENINAKARCARMSSFGNPGFEKWLFLTEASYKDLADPSCGLIREATISFCDVDLCRVPSQDTALIVEFLRTKLDTWRYSRIINTRRMRYPKNLFDGVPLELCEFIEKDSVQIGTCYSGDFSGCDSDIGLAILKKFFLHQAFA